MGGSRLEGWQGQAFIDMSLDRLTLETDVLQLDILEFPEGPDRSPAFIGSSRKRDPMHQSVEHGPLLSQDNHMTRNMVVSMS
jgi:hypothetical protein